MSTSRRRFLTTTLGGAAAFGLGMSWSPRARAWGELTDPVAAGPLASGPHPVGGYKVLEIFMYGGVGQVREERIQTFGTRGRVYIPEIQKLFRYVTDPRRAVEHHAALVVGTRRAIATTMKAVRDALPYINAQAGLNGSGLELVEYYEHNTVEQL